MHRTCLYGCFSLGRIARFALWCLLAMGWSACRFSTSPIDAVAIDAAVQPPPVAEPAAGSGARPVSETAEPSPVDTMQAAGIAGTAVPPSAGSSSAPVAGALEGAGGTPASAGMTAAAPEPAGQGGQPAPPSAADAGAQPVGDGAVAAPTAADGACAFEFAACLAADPLNYGECARLHAAQCAILGLADASVPSLDGAPPLSAACLLEEANCLMLHPERANECILAAAACTL